jgi:hypothetical protein
VPLDEHTQYSHRQKLVISGGRHAWSAEPPVPQQTQFDLNCDAQSLCSLEGITVSQSAGMAGYAWRAIGDVPLCGGGPTSTPIHRLQSISIADNPESALKSGACGYTGKPLLAYELLRAPGSPRARNFYVDPFNDRFHLRAVTLDTTTPIDQTTPLSWGQFSQPIDSMAVHPSGYVVGVNTAQHRLEIVTLRDEPVPDAQAVSAVLKAGRGTRIGLLDTPIAVGVDLLSQAILVLEGGNRRLQAFDCYGNQLLHFADKSSGSAALHDEGSTPVQYLDMAVESTGYIYVLSFHGSGRNDPKGKWLSQTRGLAAARLAVDKWRNLFTLNYEAVRGPRGLEPSISEWIPSTPMP